MPTLSDDVSYTYLHIHNNHDLSKKTELESQRMLSAVEAIK